MTKDQRPYISIDEACEMLGISRPTFDKIRKKKILREVFLGKRPRFFRDEILRFVEDKNQTIADQKLLPFTVFSRTNVKDLETVPNTFDLTRIEKIDPYGVLILFTAFVNLANSGKLVNLSVADDFICNHLRSLGFFIELEKIHPTKIFWNKEVMTSNYEDFSYPIPLTGIHMRKQEAPVVEKLQSLLRKQGLSEDIGGYIGWIIGELVDNSMTHLVYNGTQSDCYILSQRFQFKDSKSECVIIGVADLGPGIHNTLRKNPKYAELSDQQAFLTAFKPLVSSWADKYGRGKGLTDVLSIAMGNQSILLAESVDMRLYTDFRKQFHSLTRDNNEVPGTRFALVLIDQDFELKSKKEVSQFVDKILGEL